ncbi:MAG TPA: thioredoxin domain-containing protein [Polyangiaceae bacterium]|nr:thioredoxin domain-containing protein [Polyangiaceae bacterium]
MKGTPSARVTAAGLALGGLLLSALLEWLHVKAYGAPGASSFCTVGKRLDCTAVALASSSVVLGLPLPIWGILGFSALGVAAWLGSAWLVPLAFGAALASVALLGVELFDVGALCFLCEAVHAVAFALAVVAWRARRTLAPLADRERAALVLLPPLGGMIALLIFLPPYFRTVTFRGELPFADGVTPEGEPWIGAKNPKLTLEEYTDYRCPHCRTASSWTLHRLAAHPNDIRIVRGQQPLARCLAQRGSCDRLRFAYCAQEQGRFWQMDRWLFAHGDEHTVEPARAASDLGIDGARFASCVERADTYARAERESAASERRHFAWTPTYVLNGKRIPSATADRYLERGRAE